MSHIAISFLVVLTLGLALLLSFLGFTTLGSNPVGWFLLLMGLVYFLGAIVVYWIRGIRFWGPQAEGEIVKEERNDGSFWAIAIGLIAAFYLPPLEYLCFNAILPENIWMQITGWALLLCGSVLFIWARRVLGKYYSGHVSVLQGQPLVQSGPYQCIRHPAYAGYVLIALGISVGYSSVVGFIVIVFLLLPAVIYRLSLEDKLLATHFRDQFIAYAKKTARLIPGVW